MDLHVHSTPIKSPPSRHHTVTSGAGGPAGAGDVRKNLDGALREAAREAGKVRYQGTDSSRPPPGPRLVATSRTTSSVSAAATTLTSVSDVYLKTNTSLQERSVSSRKHVRSNSHHGAAHSADNSLNGSFMDAEAIVAANRKAKVAEFENSIISKQRGELQLLISELKDRDKELNTMVSSHQQQIAAWDSDRQKNRSLEDRLKQTERELEVKNDEVRSLVAKLHTLQSSDQNKATALESTQEQLAFVTEQQTQTSSQNQHLQDKIRSQAATIQDLDEQISQMEAREQELLSVLTLKDRNLSEASSNIAEVTSKLKRVEEQLEASRATEAEVRRHVSEWKNKHTEVMKESQHNSRELLKSEQRCDDQKLEIQRLKQEISTLRKEVLLATEREKRKDQVLELQKSKHERVSGELSALRGLYERQQRDLAMLHLNLDNTRELLSLHQRQNAPQGVARFLTKDTAATDTAGSTYTSPSARANTAATDRPFSTSTPHKSYSSYSTGKAGYESYDYTSRRSPSPYSTEGHPVLPEPVKRDRNFSQSTEGDSCCSTPRQEPVYTRYDLTSKDLNNYSFDLPSNQSTPRLNKAYTANAGLDGSFLSDVVDDLHYKVREKIEGKHFNRGSLDGTRSPSNNIDVKNDEQSKSSDRVNSEKESHNASQISDSLSTKQEPSNGLNDSFKSDHSRHSLSQSRVANTQNNTDVHSNGRVSQLSNGRADTLSKNGSPHSLDGGSSHSNNSNHGSHHSNADGSHHSSGTFHNKTNGRQSNDDDVSNHSSTSHHGNNGSPQEENGNPQRSASQNSNISHHSNASYHSNTVFQNGRLNESVGSQQNSQQSEVSVKSQQSDRDAERLSRNEDGSDRSGKDLTVGYVHISSPVVMREDTLDAIFSTSDTGKMLQSDQSYGLKPGALTLIGVGSQESDSDCSNGVQAHGATAAAGEASAVQHSGTPASAAPGTPALNNQTEEHSA